MLLLLYGFAEMSTQPKLKKFNFATIPSEANFVLAKCPAQISSNKLTEKLAKKYGIIVRDCGHKKELKNMVRITVGSPCKVRRLIRALQEIWP